MIGIGMININATVKNREELLSAIKKSQELKAKDITAKGV